LIKCNVVSPNYFVIIAASSTFILINSISIKLLIEVSLFLCKLLFLLHVPWKFSQHSIFLPGSSSVTIHAHIATHISCICIKRLRATDHVYCWLVLNKRWIHRRTDGWISCDWAMICCWSVSMRIEEWTHITAVMDSILLRFERVVALEWHTLVWCVHRPIIYVVACR